MSRERRVVLKAYGAELVLTPPPDICRPRSKGPTNSRPSIRKYFMPGQFTNRANPEAHIKTTAPEIDHDTGGNWMLLLPASAQAGPSRGWGILQGQEPQDPDHWGGTFRLAGSIRWEARASPHPGHRGRVCAFDPQSRGDG